MSPTSTSTAAALAPTELLDTLPSGWPEDYGYRTLGFHAWAWTKGLEWDWRRAEWRQRWKGLIQPNGPRAGKVFRATERQFRFWLWFYALDNEAGWVYSESVRQLAKGSGKSPSAAVTALIEFLAPVRLAQFDARAPGGTIGRPVDMPLVQIAATAESQSVITMRMVRAFASKKSPVAAEYNLDSGKTKIHVLPEGTLEIITSSATAVEGAESSFVVADQTELWTPSNGGVDLAEALSDNLTKSGSRMLSTPNAWVPGRDSVAEAAWDEWVAQQEGRIRGDGRVLYDAVKAAPGTDMSNPDELRAELQRIYWDCDWKRPHGLDGEPLTDQPPDIESIMLRIWSPKARPDNSRRKYFNEPAVAQDAWIDPAEWAVLADPTVVVDPAEPVVLFFDGSKSRDATALVGCTTDAGHVFTLGVWEPDQNDPDETVDVADVDRVVANTFEAYNVVAFFADVREWEQFSLTTWPQRYREQLLVWAAPSSRPPQPVAWDMRGHGYEFAKATEAAHNDITTQMFTHDGDGRTARHMKNARRRPYRDAVAVGKESKDSPHKIDAAVCVIGARMVRRIVLGSGKLKKRSGKVY